MELNRPRQTALQRTRSPYSSGCCVPLCAMPWRRPPKHSWLIDWDATTVVSCLVVVCAFSKRDESCLIFCMISNKTLSAGVRDVSRTIFVYAFVLGLALAGALGLGDYTGFLLKLFTTDMPTKKALKPLLFLLIVAQPLNSFVFAADGVLQGACFFAYQATTMVLSVLVAFVSFFCLGHFGESQNTLVFVWYSLLVLQLMRGITSLWKLVDPNGPIDLFHRHSRTRLRQQEEEEHDALL